MDRAATLIEQHLPRLESDPGFTGAASLALFDMGEVERAGALADASLALSPVPSLDALVASASAALAHNDSVRARERFEQALRLRPDDGRSWSGLGLTSMQDGNLVLATQQLERAVEHMPAHLGTWHMLGWCRLLQRDLAGARAAFLSALERDRNFGESHGAMAVILAFEGARQEAEAAIERALRLDPKGLSACYAGMVLAGEVDDPVRLREVADRLLRERTAGAGASVAGMVDRFQQRRS
jgi:Flp pilus assembly protein TadD